MSLLHNTDIELLVKTHLQGEIARVGGRMNQLMNYKNCKVTDINIVDGGYGMVRNKFSLNSLKNYYKAKKRQLRQEVVWMLNGEREMRDRKTLILDMHFAFNNAKFEHKFDNIVSSNVIEHSPNPILFLLNFHFLTKADGFQYHAIPNHRYTFDKFREITTLKHMVDDFEKKIWFDDITHNEDYSQSAIVKHGHQRVFHQKYPVSYPYIHFHVFDESNVKELFEFVFTHVTVDCIQNEKYNDNLVICSNKLNPEFETKYADLIKQYKEFVQLKGLTAAYSKL